MSDGPTPGLAAALEALLFERLAPGEAEALDPALRTAMVQAGAAALARRAPGTVVIEQAAATDAEPGRRHSVLAIVNDDMPFLVDSVSATVTAAGLGIDHLAHPILDVERAGGGALAAAPVLARGPAGTGHARESLIVLAVERAPAKVRAELVEALRTTLASVRAAVADWQPMLARVRTAARGLNDSPPPLPPHVVAESIAFLDWLAQDNFTFLGFASADGSERLGLLRDRSLPLWTDGSDEVGTDGAVVVAKADTLSPVHRRAPLDVVAVRRFDGQGRAVGEDRFVGLFTSAALAESPRRVPLIRRKVATVVEALGFDPRGHAGKALVHVIEAFPRDELFQVDADRLRTVALGLLSLLDRPRPKLFVRAGSSGHGASALLYMPRDSYSAELREKVGRMLEEHLSGRVTRFDVELRAEGMARVHYLLTRSAGASPVDERALNAALTELVRGWEEAIEGALAGSVSPARAARLAISHGRAFSPAYRAEFTPAEAAADILRVSSLSDPSDRDVAFWRRAGDPAGTIRLKIYRLAEIIALSDAVPVLENFGFRVIEEFPFDLAGGRLGWVHDFRLEAADIADEPFEALRTRIEPSLKAVLTGAQENDQFNALVTAAGLDAEEAGWLRAYFRYLRQTGVTYGVATVVDALRRNGEATRALVALFRARHAAGGSTKDAALDTLDAALTDVASIDDDRILRLYRSVMLATLRTNAFVPGIREGAGALAFKLDSRLVPNLPPPVPWREIWVYSPRVEGIHLRGGPIARGGLRWSDRRDDFRTEVLGLVKAQMVKNAVIVPTGAKGGFFAKQLPPASDRDAWAAEGTEAYRIFIRALLSVTDNLDAQGRVVPPADVVRHDADDPYLVVAADKGTATFSDVANAIAIEHGFWLGDAFASGGSNGYDHKAMGITARGAWISVQRHFRELGIDVQTQPVTVAGVGDMSGDVFGNGMLLSPALKLVAAFDHRHIFLDPSPDPAASFAERRRLFDLPRSSWADYDTSLISAGGGVFPRTQKSIPLLPPVRALLGLEADAVGPSELIAAILKAPVDLLWFGGIGTYVKAAAETNAEVGDRANDAHRVDGEAVRARVVGEGANLALTQAGRIAFARRGGRINTDFIDNSAGVDTSDHEVNIKIALAPAAHAGSLDEASRDALLVAMTDEVAELVLADNRAQTLALSVAEAAGAAALPAQQRLVQTLEIAGRLDRAVEGLPTDDQLAQRLREGVGLERPELAVLLSYTKMELKDVLVASPVVDDPLLVPDLHAAFPRALRDLDPALIDRHRLRREIVATKLANRLVNRGGLTLAHELAEEFGVGLPAVAGAFVAARVLFDLSTLWRSIDAAEVSGPVQLALHARAVDGLRVQMADLLALGGTEAPSALVERLRPGIGRIDAGIDRLLRPEPRAQVDRYAADLAKLGAPEPIAARLTRLQALDGAAGVAALAADIGAPEEAAAAAYTRLGEALGLDWAKGAAAAMAPADPWERLLAASLTRDFEALRLDLVRRVATGQPDPLAAVEAWLAANADRAGQLAGAVAQARRAAAPTLPMLAHLAALARGAMG